MTVSPPRPRLWKGGLVSVLCPVFTVNSSKMANFKTKSFGIVTACNDKIPCVKHVLRCKACFSIVHPSGALGTPSPIFFTPLTLPNFC